LLFAVRVHSGARSQAGYHGVAVAQMVEIAAEYVGISAFSSVFGLQYAPA
jgi:hypothetical protein